MNKPLRRWMFGVAVTSLLALGACGAMPGSMSGSAMMASLSGGNEVPPVKSAASGRAEVGFDSQTNQITWTVTYSGLSGPATAAHFHGPAAGGQNAGVVLPITGGLMSPITGSATITSAQAAELRAGKWYVNVHTAANPGGEIRGQVGPRS